jgi:transposase
MPTPRISEDLRARIVEHYMNNPRATYESTAEHYGVGEASVSRFLRVYRETGKLMPPQPIRKPKNKIDLDWLRERVLANPDVRLKDIVQAFAEERGIVVCISTVHNAMAAIGFTKKKRKFLQRSEIARECAGFVTTTICNGISLM